MKTCIYCGFSGETELFVKGKNRCKKCSKEMESKRWEKKKQQHDPNIIKRCNKCGKEGAASLFLVGSNICIKCKSKVDKKTRVKKIMHPTKMGYFKCGTCGFVGTENQFTLSSGLCKACQRIKDAKHYQEHREELLIYFRNYSKTPEGKATAFKHNSKRKRNLGHKPMNKWFEGSNCHHLMYTTNYIEQDRCATIYIPEELHKSISHDGTTGRNMRDINIAALEWYLKTPHRKGISDKAEQLLAYYREHPEPAWNRESQGEAIVGT